MVAPRPGRVLFAALAVLAALAGACVEVPDGIRAQFAPARPGDRSNYRPGPHGLAPPDDAPAAPKAAGDASVAPPAPVSSAPDASSPEIPDASLTDPADAGAAPDAGPAGSPALDIDGGVS